MEKLSNQLVECHDDSDTYYKVTVYQKKDGTCTATIPEMGRVQVAKEFSGWNASVESFAWKIQKGVTNANKN